MKQKLTLLFVLLICCVYISWTKSYINQQSVSESVKKDSTLLYKIYKIDSIHNYYLIYAERYNIHYKIVSEKTTIQSCERIKLNNEYMLSLKCIWYPPELVTCLYFDDSTAICIEENDSINSLFKADNIKGLCVQPPLQ